MLIGTAGRLRRCRRRRSTPRSLTGVPMLKHRSVSERVTPVCGGRLRADKIGLMRRRIRAGKVKCATLLFSLSNVPRRGLPCVDVLRDILKVVGAGGCRCDRLFGRVGMRAKKVKASLRLCASMAGMGRGRFHTAFRVGNGTLCPGVGILFSVVHRVLVRSSLKSRGHLGRVLTVLGSELRVSFLSSKRAATTLHSLSCASPVTGFGSSASKVNCCRIMGRLRRGFRRGGTRLVRGLERVTRRVFHGSGLVVDCASSTSNLTPVRRTFTGVTSALRARRGRTRVPYRVRYIGHGRKFGASSGIRCITEANGFVSHNIRCAKTLRVLGIVLDCSCL